MNPFADSTRDRVADWGEERLIRAIGTWLGPDVVPPPPAGIGDDCAVIATGRATGHGLVTVDPVVYGRHFDASCPAPRAGAKLVNRNLSDLAAMGGWPRWAVISLVLSADTSKRFAAGFFRGVRDAALPWNLHILGGDISAAAGREFIATMTLYGEAVRPVTRATAEPGMSLWVSGHLGGSLLGHERTFQPRVKEGQWLAASAAAAMMDLTDGLAKDLPHLLAPGAAAEIDADALPIARAAHRLARTSGKQPVWHACNDGEDYELLWALPANADGNRFRRNWQRRFPHLPASNIGRVIARSKARESIVWRKGLAPGALSGHGFTHF